MQNVLKKIPRWIQLAIVGVIYGATQWWYSTLAGTMKIWRDNQLPGIHSSPIFNEEGVALVVTMLVTGFSVSVLGSFFGPGRLQFRWFCAGVIMTAIFYLTYLYGGPTGRSFVLVVVAIQLFFHLASVLLEYRFGNKKH